MWVRHVLDGRPRVQVALTGIDISPARYEQILREQGWRTSSARVGIANEPDGAAAFFWVLAETPGSSRS